LCEIVSATIVRTAIAIVMSWPTGGIMLLLWGSSQCYWWGKVSDDKNFWGLGLARKIA